MPITLQADLVRLAKLARVGQHDLYYAVQQCCSNSSSSPFTSIATGLEALVTQAAVNVSAITGAVFGGADGSGGGSSSGGSSANVTKLAGRLLNNGGIKGCKVGH